MSESPFSRVERFARANRKLPARDQLGLIRARMNEVARRNVAALRVLTRQVEADPEVSADPDEFLTPEQLEQIERTESAAAEQWGEEQGAIAARLLREEMQAQAIASRWPEEYQAEYQPSPGLVGAEQRESRWMERAFEVGEAGQPEYAAVNAAFGSDAGRAAYGAAIQRGGLPEGRRVALGLLGPEAVLDLEERGVLSLDDHLRAVSEVQEEPTFDHLSDQDLERHADAAALAALPADVVVTLEHPLLDADAEGRREQAEAQAVIDATPDEDLDRLIDVRERRRIGGAA